MSLPRTVAIDDRCKHRMGGTDATNSVNHRKRNVSRFRSGYRRTDRRNGDRTLDYVVICRVAAIGAVLGIANQINVHDIALHSPYIVKSEPEASHRLASNIMNEDVGLGAEFQQRLPTLWLLNVEGEAALVSVRV